MHATSTTFFLAKVHFSILSLDGRLYQLKVYRQPVREDFTHVTPLSLPTLCLRDIMLNNYRP